VDESTCVQRQGRMSALARECTPPQGATVIFAKALAPHQQKALRDLSIATSKNADASIPIEGVSFSKNDIYYVFDQKNPIKSTLKLKQGHHTDASPQRYKILQRPQKAL
jgi:hypothetical protein